MNECQNRGCRNLETKCKDCGRLVCDKTLAEVQEWISIEDRLPPTNFAVLTIDQFYKDVFCFGILSSDEEDFYNSSIFNIPPDFNVTHWMPLPKPPEEIS